MPKITAVDFKFGIPTQGTKSITFEFENRKKKKEKVSGLFEIIAFRRKARKVNFLSENMLASFTLSIENLTEGIRPYNIEKIEIEDRVDSKLITHLGIFFTPSEVQTKSRSHLFMNCFLLYNCIAID